MAPKKTLLKTTKKTIRETVQVSVVDPTTKTPVTRNVSSKEKIEILTEKTPQEPQIFQYVDTLLEEEQNGIESVENDRENSRETREIKVQEATPTPEKQETSRKTTSRPGGGDGGGRRKKRRKLGESGGGEGYKRYLHKVLKQVHPDLGITSKTMTIINNLMSDMFERLSEAGGRLSDYNKKMTLGSREIQGAVKLVIPGELGKHAIAEGNKAVTNYLAYGGDTGARARCWGKKS